VSEIKVEAPHKSLEPSQAKVAKTAVELAGMIETDIAKHPGVPQARVCGDGLRCQALGPVDTYRIHRMMAARVTTA